MTISFDTRADAIAATIPPATKQFTVYGYTTVNDGPPSDYVEVSSPSPAKPWHIQTADSRWWSLWAPGGVQSLQLGAKGDGVTDDTVALQAWLDYASAFNVPARANSGTYVVPTGSLLPDSGVLVEGPSDAVFRRTKDVSAELFLVLNKNRVTIRGITIDTTAGFTSTTSNTVSLGSKTFTVPTGMNWAVNSDIELTPAGDTRHYLIAKVTAYSGTSLTVNVVDVKGPNIGSTWANWIGVWATTSASAITVFGSTDCVVEGVKVNGRYYIGIMCQNTDGANILGNSVVGVRNRPFYLVAATGTARDNNISNNIVRGGGYAQYGINCNGSTAGTIRNTVIHGNRISGTMGQGVAIAGAMYNSVVSGNTFEGLASNAAAILVSAGNGYQIQYCAVVGNTFYNVSTGIWILDGQFINVSANNIYGGVIGILFQHVGFSCLYNSCIGNTINAAATYGIRFTAATAAYCGQSTCNGNVVLGSGSSVGISLDGNTDRISYSGNFSLGNGSGNLVVAGTNHSTGNISA
ncbi:MAG: hypothetical protein GY873_17525 [Bosea sp.]|uniref:right-handed parallel beta-helix repeat-containing protein n=1 Tax=Bosea sp. (in: a-proteobacteria) TaxID=1871050 RepID=UPI002386D10A|nr:hypothetical protein [Bosea sp. (in: a-proteobacteria)]MCP4735989.1 hypothetical protein [Bosea sp. (in: a-proteobacteria)]